MMRLLTLLVLGLPLATFAQDVSAFLDYMGRLYVFDRGVIKQIEGIRPKSFAVGGDYVAYADARGDLKVYVDGRDRVIDRTVLGVPTVTDHFLGFETAGVLKVFDGEIHTLCGNTAGYVVEDSVAAFRDGVRQTLNAYYKGRIIQLEDVLAGDVVNAWKAGDNVIAWVSARERNFKVFYRGETQVLGDLVSSMDFKCGLDIVAFQDPYDQGFKVFHKGVVYDLEGQMPVRYEVGKGTLAYLDLTGALKVFQEGMIYTARDFEPDSWQIVDSLVIIEDLGQFRVFSEGKLHTLGGQFIPSLWEASWGSIAYLDNNNAIRVWRNEVEGVIDRGQPVRELRMHRGLVTAVLGTNNIKIWWRGRSYSH
ncbi:MAG: hypothetical protein KDB88_05660 [Flavobacteriales bacterium]|nr:hypothetical protein [Flavobacteriales bacterium]MCB0794204.1 hypothetical protein [Flavobacteriales bacterium]